MYRKSSAFLEDIVHKNIHRYWWKEDISLVIVSHILPDKWDFIKILSKFFTIEYIIPKPKSIDPHTLEKMKHEYNIWHITREEIYHNRDFVIDMFHAINHQIIIIDIGGYFAHILETLEKTCNQKIIWVIEDTENWYQKYEKIMHRISTPIISVARSTLKQWEDFLVGQSVVFSTDYVLRWNNILLHNKYAGIIWFWKIGKSIAMELKWKNIQLWINDINPYKWIEILTYGYNFLDTSELFTRSDIIFLATWNFSLQWKDFEQLKNGVIIASVTSSDDELDIQYLKTHYTHEVLNAYTTRYTKNWKDIYVLYEWNAINFINNAVVWEFIYLVQAEIIHAIFSLMQISKTSWINIKNNYIQIIEDAEKIYIPQCWLQYFNN